MKKRIPNFFIVGGAKCATTTLYKWLSQHPDIFMPEKKEPSFFCDHERNFQGPGAEEVNSSIVTSPEEYNDLFASASDNNITGEASTEYLTNKNAPFRIKEYSPNAKIIIILRNPAQRAFSQYMHLIRERLEDKDFLESIRLEKERIAHSMISIFWHVTRGLYYEGVKRYLDLFGDQNTFIRLYEDIQLNPELVVQDIFNFLGVNHHSVNINVAYNVSGKSRSRFLLRLIQSRGSWKVVAKRILGESLFYKLGMIIRKINLSKKEELNPLVEAELISTYFREDILKLQKLIGRDLSGWLGKVELAEMTK